MSYAIFVKYKIRYGMEAKVIFAVVKQVKQLQRKSRKKIRYVFRCKVHCTLILLNMRRRKKEEGLEGGRRKKEGGRKKEEGRKRKKEG